MIRNPIRDIIVVGTIAVAATCLFIEYVILYEKKNGTK